jgi:sec-independent protein translocase protein TatA
MFFLAFGMPAAPEWIFISILALVLFGPKKLPELARGIGKALAELQKAKEDFHREITGVPPMPTIKAPEGLQSVSASKPPVTEGSSEALALPTPDAATHEVAVIQPQAEEKK